MPTEQLHINIIVPIFGYADLPQRILQQAIDGQSGIKMMGQTIAFAKERQVKARLQSAIKTLNRAEKVHQGMTAARRNGRALGRPVTLSKILPEVKRLVRSGLNGSKIHRRLAVRPGAPSQAWVYQQIAKIKSA